MAPTPGAFSASCLAALALLRTPWPLAPAPLPLAPCQDAPTLELASASEPAQERGASAQAAAEGSEGSEGSEGASPSASSSTAAWPPGLAVLAQGPRALLWGLAAAEALFAGGGLVLLRRVRRRRRLREAQRQLLEAVRENFGPPEGFRGASLRELSTIWAWRGRGAPPKDVMLQVAAFLLEPQNEPDKEDLERMPPVRKFRLAKCALGTSLAFEPAALRLGNTKVWKGAAADEVARACGSGAPRQHLLVALPRGAWPWGLPSHTGVIAVWHGDPNTYTPEIPAGPPVVKLPVAALTAMDCHNRELRMEFSFDTPLEARMRPGELHGRRGALLAFSFEDSPEAAGEVAAFVCMLTAAAKEFGGQAPEVIPGLPNRGFLVPSKFYCRSTRQVAEFAWAILNIAFLTQPLWRIWKLGLFALGLDGFLKLCVSRPQTAVQPVIAIAQKVNVLRNSRIGDLRRWHFRPKLARHRD